MKKEHYEFPTGKDPAFLFGCGRFRMEEHLLEHCAEEILRFGRRPLLVCDDNSHAVAFDKVAASLAAAGFEPRELRHHGFCNREDALACAEAGDLDGIDVVLGCGGGVVLDFSKLLADIADVPVVTMPTSSAQCCAYTPISPCYTREGRYVSTTHFRREVAMALLDTTILSRQPSRLLAAGALDAMAKKIEIEFWAQMGQAGGAGDGAAYGIASVISDYIYADIDGKIDAAMADLAKGEPTPALRDVFFDAIVGAGVVSGISGGSRQTAIGHRFYYFSRTHRPADASRFTHGELVAVGLVMQLAYNGHPDASKKLVERLHGWGLAASVGELGFPCDAAEFESCVEYMLATKDMKAAVADDPGAEARLRKALETIFK